MTESRILGLEEIGEIVKHTLLTNGANEETSQVLANVIMSAERDGHTSHGFKQLPSYVSSIRVESPTAAILRVDGGNGYAQIARQRVCNQAMEMARLSGCVVIALRNVHHIGPLGPDIEPYAEQGFCALTFVNTLALMVPWQGEVAAFGTNPMAFACPRLNGPPIVWDQATSVMSKGKIAEIHSNDEKLEEAAG